MPAGTSLKTFFHYYQEANTGKFHHYDFGLFQNWITYNAIQPPEYDISKIQVPIGIFWSDNDFLVHPKVSKNSILKL